MTEWIFEAWAWIKINWGTVISMSALGVAIRRIELAVKHKKSNDRKALYDRIGALEIEQSSLRSEIIQLNKSYRELREGCKLLETKADSAILRASNAETQSETMLRIAKKR